MPEFNTTVIGKPETNFGFAGNHPANIGSGVFESVVAFGLPGSFPWNGALTSVLTGKSSTPVIGTPAINLTEFGPAINLSNGAASLALPARSQSITLNNVTMACIITPLASASSGVIMQSGSFAEQFHLDAFVLKASNNATLVSSGITLQVNTPYFVSYSWSSIGTNNLCFVVVNLKTGQIKTVQLTAGRSPAVSGATTNYGGGFSANAPKCDLFVGMISQAAIGEAALLNWVNKGVWSFWYPVRDPLKFGRVGTATFIISSSATEASDTIAAHITSPIQINSAANEPLDIAAVHITSPTIITAATTELPDNVSALIVSLTEIRSAATELPDNSNAFIFAGFNPQIITFPPLVPTTQTKVIPAYLYKEYEDDDDLQAFIASYNQIAQNFIDTVNDLNLPIYTQLSGPLLDWVGAGLYGYPRPSLFSFKSNLIGPLNTWELDGFGAEQNFSVTLGSSNVLATNDDIYKRLLTWYEFKTDGRYFTIRWLKRRIMRFLIGTNGSSPNIDQTYQISVTFGSNNTIAIRFIDYDVVTLSSAQLDVFELNSSQSMLNEWVIEQIPLEPLPDREIFQDAVTSGAIELPFQYIWDVQL